jgi:hypothetical protein
MCLTPKCNSGLFAATHCLITHDIRYPMTKTDDEVNALLSIDLDEISEELAVLERDAATSGVVKALRDGGDLESYKASISSELRQIESQVVSSYLGDYSSLLSLYRSTKECISVLTEMESTLSGYSDSLRGVSDDIRQLQFKSEELQAQLKDRVDVQEKLTSFVDAVVLPPDIVASICEDDPGSEAFIQSIELLSAKLEKSSNYENSIPSVEESRPEFEKIKMKAVHRIREFLLAKFNSLKVPKTNIQLIQINVLLKSKKLINFIKIQNPEMYLELINFYCSFISKINFDNYKNYVNSLNSKFLITENIITKLDSIGNDDSIPQSDNLTAKLKLFASPTPPAPTAGKPVENKIPLFSILTGNREKIISENSTEIDPIPVGSDPPSARLHPEFILRSHQKVLVDICSSEYGFLLNFFNFDNKHELIKHFNLIFDKLFNFINDQINSNFIANFYDPISLLNFIFILERFQNHLITQKKISALDPYFEALLLQVRARFKVVMEANIDSIKKINVNKICNSSIIVKKSAELESSLLYINSSLISPFTNEIGNLSNSIISLLKNYSKKNQNSEIFMLNNLNIILSIFRGKGKKNGIETYEEMVEENIKKYVNLKINENFNYLIKFVLENEPNLNINRNSEIEKILINFNNNWKNEFNLINQTTSEIFQNSSFAKIISQRTLTEILMYYMRLCKLGGKVGEKYIVPQNVILAEIKSVYNN